MLHSMRCRCQLYAKSRLVGFYKCTVTENNRYIDDVLSINNPYFAKKLDSTNIHKMTGGGGAVVFNATFNNISVT
jgi:hypothetical protein